MNFNSLEFLIFLPIVLAGYWILPFKARWVWLLGASYYFYMSWNAELFFLILTTTVVSYLAALGIEKKPAAKKPLLILTLLVCLGILVYFKYTGFLVNSFYGLWNYFTGESRRFTLDILLPVGISFYTFQTLSYVIDVYRGDFPAERHFGYYALFVSYFPQLVAGPIESAGNLLPQLKKRHYLNEADFMAGLRILLIGFFRKCVVADFCGIYVNRIFADLPEMNGLTILLGGALFCIQMYCDFAGYSEIATGAARMMGIRLMRNFNQPYLSTSYAEFFRRWHISLNRWFTSYVYIPLGGSRCGKLRRMFNSTLVFFLCGLWHGASWTYVLWGLYAAFFVAIEGVLKKPFFAFCQKAGIDLENAFVKLVRRSYMFLIFIPAAILFRSATVADAGTALFRLFTAWQGEGPSAALAQMEMPLPELFRMVLCLVTMCLVVPFGEYHRNDPEPVPLQGAAVKTGDPLLVPDPDPSRDVSAAGTAAPDGSFTPPIGKAEPREGFAEKRRAAALRSEDGQRFAVYLYLILVIALSWLSLLATQSSSAFAYFQF